MHSIFSCIKNNGKPPLLIGEEVFLTMNKDNGEVNREDK